TTTGTLALVTGARPLALSGLGVLGCCVLGRLRALGGLLRRGLLGGRLLGGGLLRGLLGRLLIGGAGVGRCIGGGISGGICRGLGGRCGGGGLPAAGGGLLLGRLEEHHRGAGSGPLARLSGLGGLGRLGRLRSGGRLRGLGGLL